MKYDKTYWSKVVSKIMKTELAKRDISYPALVAKLESIGVEVKTNDLRNRMSKGTFSAMFFVQCLRAMSVKNLPIEDSFFEVKKD